MRKLGVAALCAAGLFVAGPSAATVMVAQLGGSFDGWFEGGQRGGTLGYMSATFVYDTALGTRTGDPVNGEVLSWDISSGTPDPLQSISISVDALRQFGGPDDVFTVVLTDFTSFKLSRNALGTGFNFDSPGGRTAPWPNLGLGPLYIGQGSPFGIDIGGNFDLDAPYSRNDAGGPATFISHTNVFVGSFVADTYGEILTIAPAPVPEPAGWGLLILGFFGLGEALRRSSSRRVAA